MLRITIEENTRQDMVDKLLEWVEVLTGGVQTVTVQPAIALNQSVGPMDVTAAGPESEAKPEMTGEPAARKRGRPRKEESAPPATPAQVAPPAPAAAAPPVAPMAAMMGMPVQQQAQPSMPAQVPTHQQVVDALMAVAAVRQGDSAPTAGYERVSKILQTHKLTNVKEIKEEHRAAILAACATA